MNFLREHLSSPAAERASRLALLEAIVAAERACEEIQNRDLEAGDWARGHAEGAAIAKAEAAATTLMTLRNTLVVRLGWPEVGGDGGE